MHVMRQHDLPFSNIAREFVGADHGGAGVCLILVDAPLDTWHGFTATGDGQLRMTSIQPNPTFVTEWRS
jgi:hypothetical protein